MFYARGDHDLYRKLVAVHYYFFTAGCSLCSPLAYGLYAAAGGGFGGSSGGGSASATDAAAVIEMGTTAFGTVFYATAGFVGTVGVAVWAFFAHHTAATAAQTDCSGATPSPAEQKKDVLSP